MAQPRVWFITGASSGFGRSVTNLVLSLGEIAVAVDIRTSELDDLKAKYSSEQLLIQQCDVTKLEDITSAFAQMKETFGRCDVVFNNAGICLLGEVEGSPQELVRKLMEVNFWGASNVNREAVKFFREINPKGAGGTLLVTSSISGVDPMTCYGYYGASKAALASVTETLSKELDSAWNIKITILEPGGFMTPIGSHMTITGLHPAYSDPSTTPHVFRKNMRAVDPSLIGDPAKFATRIVEFVDAGKKEDAVIPLHLPFGKDALRQFGERIPVLQAELAKADSWSENLALGSSWRDAVPKQH